MKFIFIHGSFGSPNGNWFPELKQKLEEIGQTVIAPQFPVDNWDEMVKNGPTVPLKNQNLIHWLEILEPIAKNLNKGEKLCFVGHSLGPLFILHVVEKFHLQLDSAIFVSPFLDTLDKWEFNHANGSFYKTDFDFDNLKKLIPVSYVLYSDNDPYVKKEKSIAFGKALDSAIIPVRRAGHLNSEINLNEFPLVLDLCMTRIDMSLYQRYLEHRKRRSAQDYIISNKNKGIIKLGVDDILDEGIFHFTHLKHRGFCTFYTPLVTKFWNPNSSYMYDARKAAKRVKDFVRVFVYTHVSELHSDIIQKQIQFDLEAGIHIFVCSYDAIKDIVHEPDFGIWDDDYVCVVRQNPETGEVTEGELNSRTDDIKIFLEWEKYILSKAKKILSLEDLPSSS